MPFIICSSSLQVIRTELNGRALLKGQAQFCLRVHACLHVQGFECACMRSLVCMFVYM